MLNSILLLALAAPVQERVMTPEPLWDLERIGSTSVTADGTTAAYAVRDYDLGTNAGRSAIHVVDLASGDTRVLLDGWRGAGALQFRPTPYGERLMFAGRPDVDGASTQLYALNITDGSLKQITDVEGGVANVKVAPDAKHVAFTMDVKLDATVNEVHEDLPLADARIIDGLMYRHWDAWHDYAYSHLFVAPIGDDLKAGEPMDLMEGMRVDCPVPPFGGSEQFNWSPDGEWIAFTMKEVERWAESTDSDVHLISLDAPTERRNVSDGLDGYDNDPTFSPDGTKLAWHSMERPGFESDRNRILVLDLDSGEVTEPTAGLDQTVHGATW
ncbi:MAG: peptidase S9, partial [Planctomycetota bacterium]|nr:peptidase S9 [Planctomycetota bacterium]